MRTVTIWWADGSYMMFTGGPELWDGEIGCKDGQVIPFKGYSRKNVLFWIDVALTDTTNTIEIR